MYLYLSIYLYIYLYIYLSVCLSIYLSICHHNYSRFHRVKLVYSGTSVVHTYMRYLISRFLCVRTQKGFSWGNHTRTLCYVR